MAEVVRYINTSSTSGGTGITNETTGPDRAYATANGWETVENTNLVTAGNWHHVYCSAPAGTADTYVQISGWTTGADNYILVEAASGYRATASSWDTSKYRLQGPNYFTPMYLGEEFIRLDGLQIASGTTGVTTAVTTSSMSSPCELRISNCRIRASGGSADVDKALNTGDTDIVLKMWNTILYNTGTYATNNGVVYIGCNSAFLYNCVIAAKGSGASGIRVTSGAVTVVNAAVLNTADDFNGSFTSINYCASDDNDGTNNVAESSSDTWWTSDFTDAQNGDFTLLSSSNLVNSGLDNPGSGLFSDDIDGNTRSDWDVGASECMEVGVQFSHSTILGFS